nr:ABC transporter substrate-binding protein [Pseudogemmobacter hezensis]
MPSRVVSINLCTDQLAMMLAAPGAGAKPGQLISVSTLASDPMSSSMAAEAAAYPANRGSAEQVFMMNPDLVLAGTFTSRATVDLLRRLGVRVVEIAPVTSLQGVSDQIRQVAAALGRFEAGEALVARFEADLAALAPPSDSQASRLRAALYYPNGYTIGKGTLSDDILARTGFINIATELGRAGGGNLAMELLVMAGPDLVVTSKPYPGASRSEALLRHPALAQLGAQDGQAALLATSDADWICGTPHVLRAVAEMRAAHQRAIAGPAAPMQSLP